MKYKIIANILFSLGWILYVQFNGMSYPIKGRYVYDNYSDCARDGERAIVSRVGVLGTYWCEKN